MDLNFSITIDEFCDQLVLWDDPNPWFEAWVESQ